MISTTLTKQTFKSNFSFWMIMTILPASLIVLITALGQNVQATGLMFYQMLPSIFTGIYVIITANKLIAAQIDRGTMAYILSTPTTRVKVAMTQTLFFIVSLMATFLVTAGGHVIAAKLALNSFTSDDFWLIIKLNLGVLSLGIAFSGICFLASCLFNLSKNAVGVSGGIIGGFLLLSFLPMFSSDLKIFKDFTIVSLYDANSILSGSDDYIIKLIILIIIGVTGYILGITIFKKKDLPL